MKPRIAAFLIVIVLLLTGCTSVPSTSQEIEKQLDFGTIPENISTGDGWFAMSDGFVYTTEFGKNVIWEYDINNGDAVEVSLPKQEKPVAGATSVLRDPMFYGSMFLLRQYIAFVDNRTESFQYQDENGKTQWGVRDTASLVLLDPVGQEYVRIPELGDHVFKAIPVRKTTSTSTQQNSENTENPLAGVELYYYFGYDTFPEMSSQMAQDGITLEEPVDPNERNRYIVPALGYMDGDTRRTKVLAKDIAGGFFVDDQYIYYLSGDYEAGTRLLHRSKRENIAFETIDLGCNINNCIFSYEEGFYFCRLPDQTVCYYKEGQIKELPVISTSFKQWRDQLIYLDSAETKGSFGKIKTYNLDTGETRLLCEGAGFDFHILEDKYLGYIKYFEDSRPHILIDLETGKQTELFRKEK